jgi:hypothetical protein
MQAEVAVEPIIEELERKLVSCEDIKRYIFAGNATFTARSVQTQKRYTYKIVAIGRALCKIKHYKKGTVEYNRCMSENADRYWVRLLVGPNNETSFIYIGTLDMQRPTPEKFYTTKGSFAGVTAAEQNTLAPSTRALNFIVRWLSSQLFMTPNIEIWHSGRCGRCGKKLTVPESIQMGLGPDCAGK